MSTLSPTDIKNALAGPLPGLRGQKLMAPGYRKLDPEVYAEGSKTCRRAAVLLLIYPIDDRLYVVLTERRHDLPQHPGQISMPGGSRDGNETVTQTAIREAYEEIGVNPDDVEVLGRLTHIYIPQSHFCIQIVVGYTPERPRWRASEGEIESMLEVPLSRLVDPSFRHVGTATHQGKQWELPYFGVNGHKIWGATAMALGEFSVLLTENFPDKAKPPFNHPPIYECRVHRGNKRKTDPQAAKHEGDA